MLLALLHVLVLLGRLLRIAAHGWLVVDCYIDGSDEQSSLSRMHLPFETLSCARMLSESNLPVTSDGRTDHRDIYTSQIYLTRLNPLRFGE